ncbi:AMP-binding protein [Falsirhodobacter halotolerans]|uniref:AMP-binding protein n=1 Tax=Falsirhodobacter halotolerans TaxID=1146892 RepID=UPI001FD40D04|nr:AMP-binding protein [Falsirhodobacter halotolerans]MCJ8139274.1 AMP-binding protein [Falsirhodobacter halotolerans]
MSFATRADREEIEAEASWDDRPRPATMLRFLDDGVARHGDRPALTFRLLADPNSKVTTWDWQTLRTRAVQAANLFRSLGIGAEDRVALILPNAPETAAALLGGMIAGVVVPINPLLEPGQIAALLRETGAKVVVTLKPFPKTDIAQRVAKALVGAPQVRTLMEVDLLPHLAAPKSWVVGLMRPRLRVRHRAKVVEFDLTAQPTDLTFDDPDIDRVAACFHTGGTTGMPKLALHRVSGMIYNGWVGRRLLFTAEDVILLPLPLFHVFAAYPALMSAIASGAHVVMPTPAGYRGAGVFDALWRWVEAHRATYLFAVPTALSVLMQKKVDADISSLRVVFSGSAPLPAELFHRFKKVAGVEIIEGYGLTESTCLIAANPPDGEKKVGSVGLPMPYTEVRVDTGREIHVRGPGTGGAWLATGDLGRLDGDGYLFITGRAKDLIIRGGHNIDPADIEEALMAHPAVAMAGAIGQPDAHAGEVPCAYVELVAGGRTSGVALRAFARDRIGERAALPRHIEIVDELPKTAVGKVFKPELRRRAITRVLDAALDGTGSSVARVEEDADRGLVARISPGTDRARAAEVLDTFTVAWAWDESGR